MGRLVSWITEYSYRKAWLVIVAVGLVAGFGGYTVTNVRQELIPDIELPMLVVIASDPGARSTEVEGSVTIPLETAFESLDGLESMESKTVDNLSLITLAYDFGANLNQAEADVRAAMDSAVLPQDVTTSLLAFDPTLLPIVEFSLRGDLEQSELLALANEDIVPTLEAIDGVASVEVVGGAVREVVVAIDWEALLDAGLTYEQVANALRANNVLLPSGSLVTGEGDRPIETVVRYQGLDDIRELQIQRAGQDPVRLGDIAEVEDVQGGSVGITRSDGQPAVGIRVTKTKDANTVHTANHVTDALEELETGLPAGASVTVFQDQSEFITESIRGLVEEGAIGGILAVVVVFAFLANWRTTLVTAVSIPLSIIAAIILLDQLGYSLNIMTLAGLTIAIGRVIDDSIVVLENVYRHMVEGESAFAAIINGAREVTLAIVGATATTCAVFLPLGLTGGLIGQLFLSFSLAVAFALIASLVVAITVIPVLTRFAVAGKVRIDHEKRAGDTRLGRLYTPVLTWSLANRWKTLGIAGGLFVASLALVPLLPVVFFPPSGENYVTINVNARPGQGQQSVLEQAIGVENMLGDYDVEHFQTVITGAGTDIGAIGNIISGQGANSATISAELANGDKQDIANELRDRIAAELPNSENISVSATGGGLGPAEGIVFTVAADHASAASQVAGVAEQIAAAIAEVPDTANVATDVGATVDAVQVHVDSAAALEAGLSAAEVSSRLANLSGGRVVSTVDFGDGSLALRLTASVDDLNSIDALAALPIAPGYLLGDIATFDEVQRQVTITRIDGAPAASITADITAIDTAAISADALAAVNGVDVPDGITVEQGGIASDINEGFASMFVAIIASIVLVYGIMVLLFRSWLDPFVILFSLPLAVIGAIVALVVTGSPLSISALIGILMLVGIVVTNAIVMLEFVIMLRHERGYSTYNAIVEGAQTRLRPILMTAIAAMLALIPLSLGLTEGALIAADLGRVVIGGLFSSTLLTLVVVPVIYSLVDDFKSRFGGAATAG